jgi:diguanylate cyclase (GGDEF)-like protein
MVGSRLSSVDCVADRVPVESLVPLTALADRPSIGREQYLLAGTLIALLVLVGGFATPFANHLLTPIPGFVSGFGTSMVVINMLLAALLFSRGVIDAESRAIRLGAAYLFVAITFVPLMASFPGAFVTGQLIGTLGCSVWLYAFWHAGLGLGIIRYALVRRTRPASVVRSILGVVLIVILLTLVATRALPILPPMLADGHTMFTAFDGLVPPAVLAILAVALVLVFRSPRESRERLWLMVSLVAAGFDVWMTYRGVARFSVGWYMAKCGSLITSLSMLVSMMYDVTALRHRMHVANAKLLDLAHSDGLTGLPNRRGFDQAIVAEWHRAERERQPLSLMMIDVDFFKAYNDRYGHLRGDHCLRQIAETLQALTTRPADRVARYGGEEFVIILPGTSSSCLTEFAASLHAKLRTLAVPHEGSPFGRVTVSIGLVTAVPEPGSHHEDALEIADVRLYQAKQRGRNRTEGDGVSDPLALSV